MTCLVISVDFSVDISSRCSYCDKSFSSSSNLSEHKTIHTGRYWLQSNNYVTLLLIFALSSPVRLPYSCSKCQRRFRLWTTMKKHSDKCQGDAEQQVLLLGDEEVSGFIQEVESAMLAAQ